MASTRRIEARRAAAPESARSTAPESAAELARSVAAGEPGAFDRLHGRYRARIHAFALRRVSNPSDAEDITQEVFLQIHRSIGSYQGRSSFSTWMFGIAHNVTCRHHRSQRGRRVPLEGAEVDARLSYRPRTEKRLDAARAIDRCDDALTRSRPAEHQRIFQRFYGHGQPMRVIGQSLGRPTESVKDSLRRSRDLLKRDVPELEQALQATGS